MNTLTVPVLWLDKPNNNGRIYPSSVIEKSIYGLNPVLGTIGMPSFKENGTLDVELKDAALVASNFRIVDGVVLADIDVLSTQTGSMLKSLIESDSVSFRTAGVGKCENNIISSYKFVSIAAVSKKDAA